MKILEVIGSMNVGGAENMLLNVIKYGKKQGDSFDVLETTLEDCTYDSELKNIGCSVFKIKRFNIANYFSFKKELVTFFKQHKNQWDVVHVHIGSCAFLVFDVLKKEDCLLVEHSHNTNNNDEKNIFKKIYRTIVYRWAAKLADSYIGCGKQAAVDRFGKKKAEQALIMKNGIFTSRFSFNEKFRKEIRGELGVSNTTILIGNVARSELQKNKDYLLEIACAIKNMKLDIRIISIGGGSLLKSLQEKAIFQGLENIITFIDARNDIYKFYSAFDCFALVSFYEGFPVTFVEALSNGLPCFLSHRLPKELNVCSDVTFLEIESEAVTKWLLSFTTAKRSFNPSIIEQFDISTTYRDYIYFLQKQLSMKLERKYGK